jgi:hypothetical protein
MSIMPSHHNHRSHFIVRHNPSRAILPIHL